MVGCEELLDKVRRYASDADVRPVQRAFAMALAAEGEGPVSHKAWRPLRLADLLSELKLDVDTLAAALVFPATEQGALEPGKIEAELGEDIAGVVAAAGRLSRVDYRASAAEQAEAFRRMILAMAHDLRALFLRLADRLHTLQELSSLDPQVQRRIARETVDIYAPIANRLGIQKLKVEFEDRAMAVLQPQEYRRIDEFLHQRREINKRFMKRIQRDLFDLARVHDAEAVVTARIKHHAAVLYKMRNRDIRLEEVADLVGFRALLEETAGCYALLGDVHARWALVPGRFRDYIGRPKANGYQSLHTTVLARGGERFEVQIRTNHMHQIAELGVAAHWRYKEGHLDLSTGELAQYTRIQQLSRLLDEIQDAQELVDVLKVDLFADEIYVHTPQGEVKWLPLGATALDFAFAVHTEVGLHCVGARVNGQLVALRHRLQSGDRVEILTRKNQHPGRDWMRMAVTGRARSKIRAYFKTESREQAALRGRETLEGELHVRQTKLAKLQREPAFARALEQLKVRDAEELFVRIGYGELPLDRALRSLLPEPDPEAAEAPALPASKPTKERKKSRSRAWPVQVQGMDGMLTSIARCCHPVPGEPIVGYITRGRGVTVHRPDCAQAQRLDEGRIVPVSWSSDGDEAYNARIRVVMADRPGMLAAVTRRIGLLKINIVSCQVSTGADAYGRAVIGVSVRNLDQLDDALKKLSQVKGVISVDRL